MKDSTDTDLGSTESGRDVRASSIIAIVGPTASGKSALGIELALRLNAEIVNCDSVQVYQGIQIATAKVPLNERRGIPHVELEIRQDLLANAADVQLWADRLGDVLEQAAAQL